MQSHIFDGNPDNLKWDHNYCFKCGRLENDHSANKLDPDDVIAAVQEDDMLGFCKSCGEVAYNVEPDARNYKCESCGDRQVFGAEECLMELV